MIATIKNFFLVFFLVYSFYIVANTVNLMEEYKEAHSKVHKGK